MTSQLACCRTDPLLNERHYQNVMGAWLPKQPFGILRNMIISNTLPSKIFDQFIFEAFEDNKLTLAQMMTFVCYRVENIVGKEENAGY